MLGKLIKHEFKATCKTYSLIYLVLFALTILTKALTAVEIEGNLFSIIKALMILAYVLVVICTAFFSLIIAVERFYKNLLKDQGYLMHTIPVRTSENILAKTITFTVWGFVSFIMAIASILLLFVGSDNFSLVMNQIGKVFAGIVEYPSLVGVCIFFLFITIIQYATNLLSVFAAFSIGQIFNKHKILASVIAYFAMNYVIMTVLTIISTVVGTIFTKINDFEIGLADVTDGSRFFLSLDNQVLSIYEGLTICLIINVILFVIYFLISNVFLSKKLNLE